MLDFVIWRDAKNERFGAFGSHVQGRGRRCYPLSAITTLEISEKLPKWGRRRGAEQIGRM